MSDKKPLIPKCLVQSALTKNFGAGAPVRKRSGITMVLPAPLYQTERGLSSLFFTFGEISHERAGLGNILSNPARAPKCKVEKRCKMVGGADYSRPPRGLSSLFLILYNLIRRGRSCVTPQHFVTPQRPRRGRYV